VRTFVFSGLILAGALCLAKDKSLKAADVIDRAAQLADIRAEGQPAFHLKAEFTYFAEDRAIQGTYLEDWISSRQWRRETTGVEIHKLEVAAETKLWTVSDGGLAAPSSMIILRIPSTLTIVQIRLGMPPFITQSPAVKMKPASETMALNDVSMMLVAGSPGALPRIDSAAMRTISHSAARFFRTRFDVFTPGNRRWKCGLLNCDCQQGRSRNL
jgi:hypothetical protein